MGSEMCIRDSCRVVRRHFALALGSHTNLAWGRFLDDFLGSLRIAFRHTVLELPGVGYFLLTEFAGLFLNNLANF